MTFLQKWNLNLSLKNSSFKVKDTEGAFGDGKKYPALKLNSGEIRLKGRGAKSFIHLVKSLLRLV